MTALLYRWPSASEFGRVVPKTKFYEHAQLPASVKERFVSHVQRITWAYKLADSTVNLRSSAAVPEIQVFEVEAKGDDVAESVLAAIDRAVKTPIVFEISRGQGEGRVIRMVAAHKQIGSGGAKLGPYFSTAWQPAGAARTSLPTALDLTTLYIRLLEPLTPVTTSLGEEVSDVLARLQAVRALEREIAALERKIRNEPQLNRKFELRRTLKTKKTSLVDLQTQTPTPSPAPGNTN